MPWPLGITINAGCSPSPPGTPQATGATTGRAAVQLIRIKTLAEAGMALARAHPGAAA